MPICLVTGCGDLEPEMQDTRTVILKMGFDHRSSSRTSSISATELSQYYTHLILAVPSEENLHNSYWMYPSKKAEGLMGRSSREITLEIPLSVVEYPPTQLRVFAFLFTGDYDKNSHDQLFSAEPDVGLSGKSDPFYIDRNTNSLIVDGVVTNVLDITLCQNWSVEGVCQTLSAPTGLTATGGASQVVLDWTPVSGASSYTVYWGSATGVSSSSTSITSVSTDSYTHTGLNDGTTYYYKVAAVDSAGTGMLSSEVNATTTTVQVNDDDVSVTNTDNDTVAVVTDYALNFDGTNDYVSIPNNPFSNNNTFTIQAWLKPEVVGDGAYHGFLGMQLSGRKPSLWVNTNGNLHYDSYKGSQRFSGTISDGSNKFFTVSEWVHVGWTNDGSNYKFYKNGNLVATETAPDTFNALDNIGYQIGKVDNYFNGQIDEVAIWDVALGIANITALYNSRIGLKASVDSGNYDKSDDLVGYWQFNEGIGSTLTDNTSNSNNGTLNNMDSSPWVTSGLNLTN